MRDEQWHALAQAALRCVAIEGLSLRVHIPHAADLDEPQYALHVARPLGEPYHPTRDRGRTILRCAPCPIARVCTLFKPDRTAARYGEIAFGYKRYNEDGSFDIQVNPKSKSAVTFREGDNLIVVAPE